MLNKIFNLKFKLMESLPLIPSTVLFKLVMNGILNVRADCLEIILIESGVFEIV